MKVKEILSNDAKELKVLKLWDKLTPEERIGILKKEGYIHAVYRDGILQSFCYREGRLIYEKI